jgi:hypothetical protein
MTASRSIRFARLLTLLGFMSAMGPAFAWVYPEHRDIAVLGVESLDPERRALFVQLWREARAGSEQRLCEQGADVEQGLAPACIDWAAFTAIAGDHSCSGRNLLDTVVKTQWILSVADVAAQLKVDLGRIAVQASPEQSGASANVVADFQRRVEAEGLRAERLNALRTSDTRLQRADPEYATRAGSNNAHFLMPRPSTETSPQEYARLTLSVGSELSAVGVYAWYHLSALQKATRLATEQLSSEERQALILAMLTDEGFGLHFLEDTYAAGHVAGTWGDASQRKGTHDYYNEAGLEVFVWRGSSQSMVLMGDAHMRPEDAKRAAIAVRASLEQLLDHAAGRARAVKLPYTPAAPSSPDRFDVCANNALIAREDGLRAPPEAYEIAYEVLSPTPVPGLGPGLGSMPRFRAEVGPFIGLAGSLDLRGINGGFVESDSTRGWIGGADLSVRAGLGLDGVIGESGDGLVFASLGLRVDSPSTSDFSGASPLQQIGNSGAAIGSRIGISTRFRMPYYLIPGDLLFLSPVYLFAPSTYSNMAVTASNGGLIPWQLGMATRYGRFQFVLGRELGVTFFGYGFNNSIYAPAATPGGDARVVDLKSTYFEFPILEYRPYRAFDTNQSSAVLLQLFAGIDVPHGSQTVYPDGAPGVNLKTVYSLGIRLLFDWRRYY